MRKDTLDIYRKLCKKSARKMVGWVRLKTQIKALLMESSCEALVIVHYCSNLNSSCIIQCLNNLIKLGHELIFNLFEPRFQVIDSLKPLLSPARAAFESLPLKFVGCDEPAGMRAIESEVHPQ